MNLTNFEKTIQNCYTVCINTYVDEIVSIIEKNMIDLGKTVSNVEMSIQNALETIQNNRKEL